MNPYAWTVSTLVGSREGYVDGDISTSQFRGPASFALSPDDSLYIADRIGGSIRKIDSARSQVRTVLRNQIPQPTAIIICPEGHFLIADRGTHVIWKLDSNGGVNLYSGAGMGFADGAKTECRFNGPTALCLSLENAQCFVSDVSNHRIRLIAQDGSTTTYTGSRGGWKDGNLSEALFSGPWGLCLSSYGELFVCDWGNNRIRMIDTHKGVVTTIAGREQAGFVDGNGLTLASFNCPIALTLTPQNDLIVADRNNHRLRLLTRTPHSPASGLHDSWEVSTFAGSSSGSSDGSCAGEAKFTHPSALAWSKSGQLLVASSCTIRVIQQNSTTQTNHSETDLSTSLAILLKEGEFSDFPFIDRSGHVHALHRPILSARCAKMAQDSLWSTLELVNVNQQAWQDFFEFLYVDVLPDTEKLSDEIRPIVLRRYFELHLLASLSELTLLMRHCKQVISDLSRSSESLISSLLSEIATIGIQPPPATIAMIVDLLTEQYNFQHSAIVSTISATLQGHYDLQETILKQVSGIMKPAPATVSDIGQKVIRPTGLLWQQLSTLCSVGPSQTSPYVPSASLLATSSRPLHQESEKPVPSDFAIQVDDVQIPCLQCILYARWPYFRGMMSAGLSEVRDGVAVFPGASEDGLSPNAMRALIWYLYSNSPIMFNHETGLELLAVASRFRFSDLETNLANPGFEDLLQHCAIPIHLTPTKENSISLYKLALRYQNAEMEKQAKATVLSNLPSIFTDPKLSLEFEALDVEVKYALLKESYSKLLKGNR
jgi:hypothetical protein